MMMLSIFAAPKSLSLSLSLSFFLPLFLSFSLSFSFLFLFLSPYSHTNPIWILLSHDEREREREKKFSNVHFYFQEQNEWIIEHGSHTPSHVFNSHEMSLERTENDDFYYIRYFVNHETLKEEEEGRVGDGDGEGRWMNLRKQNFYKQITLIGTMKVFNFFPFLFFFFFL